MDSTFLKLVEALENDAQFLTVFAEKVNAFEEVTPEALSPFVTQWVANDYGRFASVLEDSLEAAQVLEEVTKRKKTDPDTEDVFKNRVTGELISPIHYMFTSLPSQTHRELFQHIANYASNNAMTARGLHDLLRGITVPLAKLGTCRVEKPRLLTDDEYLRHTNLIEVETIAVGHSMLTTFLANKFPGVRSLVNAGIEMTHNSVDVVVSKDAINATPEEVTRFLAGIKKGGAQIKYRNAPGVVATTRYILANYNFNIDVQKKTFSPVPCPPDTGDTIFRKCLKFTRAVLKRLVAIPEGSFTAELINKLQLVLCDFYESGEGKEEMNFISSLSNDPKLNEMALANARKVEMPKTYAQIVDGFAQHKLHELRNRYDCDLFNSNNASPYRNAPNDAKRPVVMKAIADEIVMFSIKAAISDPDVYINGNDDRDIHVLQGMLENAGFKIANRGAKTVHVDVPLSQVKGKIFVDLSRGSKLEEGKDNIGITKISNFRHDNLPALFVTELDCKRLPVTQLAIKDMLAQNEFGNVVFRDPPGFHNSQLLAVCTRASAAAYASRTPMERGKQVDLVRLDKKDLTVFVPPVESVPLDPATVKSKFVTFLTQASAVANFNETFIDVFFKHGVAPPECDIKKSLFYDKVKETYPVLFPSPKGVLYTRRVSAGRPAAEESVLEDFLNLEE